MIILRTLRVSFLSYCILASYGALQAKEVDRSGVCELACVNDTSVTSLDVSKRKKLLTILSQNRIDVESDKFLESTILESIIQEKVKFAYAQRIFKQAGQPLVISPNEIANEINDMSASYGLTSKEFIQFLKDNKVDIACLEDHIKNDLAWSIYLSSKYGNLINLSDSEIKNYRNKLKNDYRERAYNVERLFFPYMSFGGDKSKAEKFVCRLVQLLKSGISFDILSRIFSSLSSSTGSGSYGFITVGQLPYKLENEQLKRMRRGETAIVKMNSGISLIRVSSVRAALSEAQEIVSFRYVIDTVDLKNQKLLEDRYIKYSNLSQKYNKKANDLIRDAKSLGYSVSDTNEVAITDLPEEIRKIISSIKVGEFSAPIVTQDGILSICLLKKEIFKISVPTIDECKNKLYEDKINNMSDTEYRNALKSVYVERKR